MKSLKDRGAEDILIICGGIIPEKDHDYLTKRGVSAIFGPGTPITQIARKIISLTSKHLKRMHNFRSSRLRK